MPVGSSGIRQFCIANTYYTLILANMYVPARYHSPDPLYNTLIY